MSCACRQGKRPMVVEQGAGKLSDSARNAAYAARAPARFLYEYFWFERAMKRTRHAAQSFDVRTFAVVAWRVSRCGQQYLERNTHTKHKWSVSALVLPRE